MKTKKHDTKLDEENDKINGIPIEQVVKDIIEKNPLVYERLAEI